MELRLGDICFEIPPRHVACIIRRKRSDRHLRSIRRIPAKRQRDRIPDGAKLLLCLGKGELRPLKIHLGLLHLECCGASKGLLPCTPLQHPLIHRDLRLIHIPKLYETLVADEGTVHARNQRDLRGMKSLLQLRDQGGNPAVGLVLKCLWALTSRTDGGFHELCLHEQGLFLLCARAAFCLIPEIGNRVPHILDSARQCIRHLHHTARIRRNHRRLRLSKDASILHEIRNLTVLDDVILQRCPGRVVHSIRPSRGILSR